MDKTGQVTVNSDGGATTIVASGALDLYNKDFGPAAECASVSAESLAIDLRTAAYIDSAILRILAAAANRMTDRGKRLKVRLANGSAPLRTLSIVGFADVMDFVIDEPQEAEQNP
jgi:anti-anti-sigma regulatory factor